MKQHKVNSKSMKRTIPGLWLCALALFGCLAPACAQHPQTTGKATYQEGAFYVRFKSWQTPKAEPDRKMIPVKHSSLLSEAKKAYGIHPEMQSMATFKDDKLSRTFLVWFDSTAKTDALLQSLQASPEVEMVEKVPVYYTMGSFPVPGKETSREKGNAPGTGIRMDSKAGIPANKQEASDPFYGTINGVSYSWHLDMIRAEEAWQAQEADSSVIVAVVDNAIWGDHPDLQIPPERQYNILTGATGSSAPPASVEQDEQCASMNNCYVYNWSHGTHCAGAVGALRGNGVGIASIGSGISLMGVSCPSVSSTGQSVLNGFSGISYAVEHGARVVSLSWGNYSIAETEKAVIQACIEQGVIIVAAAGNDGQRAQPLYPANLPGVISVASVNSGGELSSFSNYGEWVTVAAPGGFVSNDGEESFACIFSTTFCQSQYYRQNGVAETANQYYDGMYGTSMATPVVSGLCGLLLSADSSLDSYLAREILMASSKPVNTANGKTIHPASGIIDAATALRITKEHDPLPRNLEGERQSNLVLLSWEEPESPQPVSFYRIYLDGAPIAETQALSYTDTTSGYGLYRYGVAAVYENGNDSPKACIDLEIPSLYQIKTTIRPEGCGKVEGGGYYQDNEEIRLTAIPEKGCQFVRWLERGSVLGRDSVLDYTVEYPTTIEAVFSGEPESSALEKPWVEAGLELYPNPASTVLSVVSGIPPYAIEIYTVHGNLALRETFSGSEEKVALNVQSLSSGLYVVKVFGQGGILTGKFSKR